ncbi:MAG: glycosyltransferase family 4 protein, partial [Candidatus Eremiobacteraeota bacterium]|nr:glycosyltransferase family 4 protein [Candidatus Eremiobacteraeota bacterium]
MNDRVEALRIRWDRKEDVEEAELARLRDDPDPAIRLLAARMTFEAAARPALEAIARAFGAEGQWNDDTQWVAASAQLARADEPVPYMLKAAGIAAVRRGDLDDAITFLTHAMAWAMRLGQSGDPRSRRLMRYALDPDFDAAYEAIAARMSLPRYYNPPEGKQRVAVLIPFDREGNSVGLAAAGFAAALCKRGFDAFVVSTRMVDSAPETEQRRWLHVAGSRFIEAGGQTTLERIAWLLDFFERDPVHAAVYMSDPQDPLPRLCEIIGLANVQLFINMAYEHRTGRLDALVQTVEPQQVERSLRPDVAVFVPSAVARDREIVAAMPASRAELGIPADAVILATFGRLSKLAQRGFLEAVTTILRDEPSAIWMIAGAGVKAELDAITGAIDGAGVRERVVILGERGSEIPALLKMSDVYLDPFPFPGAMSTGEAMFASLPVVAMRRARDVDLDPTQTGPTTAAGEAIIGDAAPMVAPNDIAAYVSLARRYVTDVAERKRVGRALRERADRELTWNGMMDRYRDVILEAISQRAPAGEDELSAVVVVPSPLALERVVARIENDDGRYAAKRIAIVINGPDADLDVRAQRYGERVQIIRLAQHVESLDAARAGIAAAGTPLCAVLDGSALPVRNWAAEGVAGARRRGYGLISGGVVVATARSEDVEEGLAALSASRTTTATQRERPVPAEGILALQDRYAAHDEFSSTEIDELCASSDGRLRALGERITFEELVEPAFDAALRLAELDDSLTHNLIAFLSGAVKARHPQAYMAAMKLRARRALSEGDLETALHAAGDGIRAAMGAAQLGIKRWHRLLHAASDPEWDALFDAAAAKLSAPRTYPAASAARSRFAIVVSVDYPVNSLSLVASRLAIGLRELGHDVCYVST